jgi:hypothetical protein
MIISDALASLINDLRQHPAFPDLIAAIPAPTIPRFRVSQAAEVEKARAAWIFESGKQAQHDLWLTILTGKTVPHKGE